MILMWVEDKHGLWHGVSRTAGRMGHKTFFEYWKVCGGGKLHGKSRYDELPEFAVPFCAKCRAKLTELVLAGEIDPPGTVV
jgi:hypothetical protein